MFVLFSPDDTSYCIPVYYVWDLKHSIALYGVIYNLCDSLIGSESGIHFLFEY